MVQIPQINIQKMYDSGGKYRQVGDAARVCVGGGSGYMGNLHLPLDFAINLKLLKKVKS